MDIVTGEDYDLYVLVDRSRLEMLGLEISQIASSLSGANITQPLGNIAINDTSYDFRVDGEFRDVTDILDHQILLSSGGVVRMSDIATLERKWSNEGQYFLGSYENPGNRYMQLTVNKKKGVSIFAVSTYAR